MYFRQVNNSLVILIKNFISTNITMTDLKYLDDILMEHIYATIFVIKVQSNNID